VTDKSLIVSILFLNSHVDLWKLNLIEIMCETLTSMSRNARSLCITHTVLLIRKFLRIFVANLAFLESVIVKILNTKGLANYVIFFS